MIFCSKKFLKIFITNGLGLKSLTVCILTSVIDYPFKGFYWFESHVCP